MCMNRGYPYIRAKPFILRTARIKLLVVREHDSQYSNRNFGGVPDVKEIGLYLRKVCNPYLTQRQLCVYGASGAAIQIKSDCTKIARLHYSNVLWNQAKPNYPIIHTCGKMVLRKFNKLSFQNCRVEHKTNHNSDRIGVRAAGWFWA